MSECAFLSSSQVADLATEFGTPLFVYDEVTLVKRAEETLAFPNQHGLTVRYAMKALPNKAVVQLFDGMGIHIDASSGYEAERAMLAGIPPEHIQITAQEMPTNLAELLDQGVLFNACSLQQLEAYGALKPGSEVSVRINPGLGSGHSNRTNVGGPSSSFGIWHEQLDEVKATAANHGLRITGLHTHIGSGSDPDTWLRCAKMGLDIARQLPEVTRHSLGGGYKIARMDGEIKADLSRIGDELAPEFERFESDTGRKLHLEIEPGSYLVANAGAVIAEVADVVNTGAEGNQFLKLNTGMTEVLRPSMYGAQHPITVIPKDGASRGEAEYMVVGHCCESGDILTPAPGDPEALGPRTLTQAEVGDYVVIDGAGAYCASMNARNYNSFPESPEVLLQRDGTARLIKRRQTLAQVLENEV